jgi:pimeloyl-ACP methyl ester carboxylesterase
VEEYTGPSPRDVMITAKTTGIQIHIRDWGGPAVRDRGEPPVILLHGLASTSRIYDLCAPLLAAQRRVVSYDQRGHGDSAKPDDGYRLETFVADGVGVAQALAIETPYVVVGHSWGGSVALRWTASHPGDVHAAVLVDGGFFAFREVPGASWEQIVARLSPPDLSAVTFDMLLARARRSLGFLDDHFLRAYLGAIMRVTADGHVRARLSRERHLQILRAMWEEDVAAVVSALRRPVGAVLAARPASDPVADEHERARRALVQHLTAIQPLLSVRWLQDTIHDVPLHRPGVLADAIAEISAAAR